VSLALRRRLDLAPAASVTNDFSHRRYQFADDHSIAGSHAAEIDRRFCLRPRRPLRPRRAAGSARPRLGGAPRANLAATVKHSASAYRIANTVVRAECQ
jgi:hypothetical protein